MRSDGKASEVENLQMISLNFFYVLRQDPRPKNYFPPHILGAGKIIQAPISIKT
jgi:hypothetical protein